MTFIKLIFLIFFSISLNFNAAAEDIFDASKGGRLEIVKQMIQDDPDIVFAKDSFGDTCLHKASAYDHEMIVKEILKQKKIDIDAVNDNNETCLFLAARFGSYNIFKFLIEKGADYLILDKDDNTILHAAAMSKHNDSSAIAMFIINKFIKEMTNDNGIDINQKNVMGMTPLHIASKSGNNETAKILIQNGSNINAKDKLSRTGLHWAAEGGKFVLVKTLINNNISINLTCINKRSALHLAVIANRVNIVKYLLANGADFKLLDNNGKTPLRIALEHNHRQIIDLLVMQGALE